jgi:hypothetical protein
LKRLVGDWFPRFAFELGRGRQDESLQKLGRKNAKKNERKYELD